MFADLKNIPTFGSNNLSAWSYIEKDPVDWSATSNPPAPNEADVKALLQMLSGSADSGELIHTDPSALYERLEMKSPPSSNEETDERVVGTHNSLEAGCDFLHLFNHNDAEDAAPKLLEPEDLLKENTCGGTPNSTYCHPASSSSNALTGSSSASSHTDRPASTTMTSRGIESTKRLSISHPSRHNTAVSNALANIGSGLAEENFNVLTPDKRMMLSIPAEYIQTTLGSRNYRRRNREKLLFSFCLCKTFCSGATCHHGSECDFIHCDPEKLRLVQSAAESKGRKADPTSVHSFQVHWSTPVYSLTEAVYPRLPGGSVVYVKRGGQGTGANSPQGLSSEMVYATVGGQEALRLRSTAPLRVCKHYEREKCARGPLCHFIHPVVLHKSVGSAGSTSAIAAATTAEANARHGAAPPSTPSAVTPFSQTGRPAPYTAPPPLPTTTTTTTTAGPTAAPLLTAAQLPSGALVRYGDALFLWIPERQQLVPVHATTTTRVNPPASPTSGQPPAMLVNIEYQRGLNGAVSSPTGFQMPANAMLVQSSSAVAAHASHHPYSSPPVQRNLTSVNAPNCASPVYPTIVFPC
ncbi:hypothetical protein ABB37_01429 [Leptomonas pyrrhocoris]|uniref:C3H1-type domain-containing protein n=1 Tax=Leptomonas pyrrhocoris TaxID=157538 RepID=A0A0M9G8Z5_LEPPY|nr:hypothetical protein ABB37_01429 [Leptomonas pyrrhocoris]KPA84996.1 hypothetical protein ABB37_01429 [Leptomonas pyrrhocoris]|eukprot:XP_015663435.1 hypothetical protein ABB37_01429 [Leptomonas pyrrhocoris]